MTSTSALLLLSDRLRTRARQKSLGMSDIGGCRRRARYKLDGYEPVNEMSSVVAVIGTAIHEQLKKVLDELGLPAEWEVEYAGLTGHFDRFEAEFMRVVDTKTVTSRWMESIKLHGIPIQMKWQLSLYAAGLITKGYSVKTCRVDLLTRDTGEEYQHEWHFDSQDVKDALEWLQDVRDAPFDLVPRDYEPESSWCRGCPFGGKDGGICWSGGVMYRDPRSVLLVDAGDAGRFAAELFEGRKEAKAIEKKMVEARGALDGLRPDDPGEIVKVIHPDTGKAYYLKWSPTAREGSYQLRFTSPPQEDVV